MKERITDFASKSSPKFCRVNEMKKKRKKKRRQYFFFFPTLTQDVIYGRSKSSTIYKEQQHQPHLPQEYTSLSPFIVNTIDRERNFARVRISLSKSVPGITKAWEPFTFVVVVPLLIQALAEMLFAVIYIIYTDQPQDFRYKWKNK